MKLRNKKTGEVKEFNEIFLTKTVKETNTATSEYVERSYCKIAELIADWEDVEPAEPLIKDEKIRKAVRAWAEALKENTIRFDMVSQGFSFGDGNVYSSINFDGFVFDLVDGKKYTIAELCGEEEWQK